MPYVLKETVSSKKQKRPIWFRDMTRLGPRNTANPDLRAVFDTEREAALCPACMHWLSIYEVEAE